VAAAALAALEFPPAAPAHEVREKGVRETVRKVEELSAVQLVETILRESDAPSCAIINEACDVVYIHGRIGKFLEPAEGKASVNILEMARPGLRAELAAAIRRANTRKQEVIRTGLLVDFDGGKRSLNLTVKPILEQSPLQGLTMVIFEEPPTTGRTKKTKPKRPAARRTGKTAEEIEQELQHTRENLQTTIEELETSNEELKSTNEELQSTNEELQSTNEELETSKEELQSLNEESATVNAELQSRIDELAKANDDIRNLLDNTAIATVFLDGNLRVQRFTPKATEIIPLAGTDVGRPIQHFATGLVDTDLAELAESVLRDLTTRELDVKSKDGRWHMMRVRPYRTVANVIDGVVITFDDVTKRVEAEAGLRRLATVVRNLDDAIMLQSQDGKILAWNRGAQRMYGYSEAEALEMHVHQLVPEGRQKEAQELLDRAFRGNIGEPLETQRLTKDGRTVDVVMSVTLVAGEQGTPEYVATTEREITGTKRPEQ
jgi:two-component system, chemotaxis family, CheB/CheR fusion protein